MMPLPPFPRFFSLFLWRRSSSLKAASAADSLSNVSRRGRGGAGAGDGAGAGAGDGDGDGAGAGAGAGGV